MKTIKGTWLHIMQLTVLLLLTVVGSAQLRADFSATPVTGCPPMVVSFMDSSTGNPISWKWDLGNGTTSFLRNPIATYFNPGKYDVKLVVTTATGKDSIIKSQYVVVNALPVVKFSAADTTGCFPLKVKFQDNSIANSGTIARWQWDFGDGTLSTEQSPAHTYTSPGIFTVILRVTNTAGCSGVLTKPGYITIRDGVTAAFSSTAVTSCQGPTTVNFVNESSGTGTLSYLWNFGDGKTSTAIHPTNNYNTGDFPVKLVVTSNYGCTDSITKTSAINVAVTRANFTFTDNVCSGNNVQFNNTSTPTNFTAVRWDFGDGTSSTEVSPGKVFTIAGTYNVKLVTTSGLCADSIIKKITILPRPVAAFSATNTVGCSGPLNVSFTNGSTNAVSYNWNFGDGTSSTLPNPNHAYSNPGTYTVTLTVTNNVGCTSTEVKNNYVKFLPLKISSINNLGVKGCLPLVITPMAVIDNNQPSSTYLWDFGDGKTSTSATPSHTYTTGGMYNVKLTVTTATGCTDTYLFTDAVKTGNKPTSQFTADPREVCASLPVNFTDLTSKGTADQWLWYFGDGGSSTKQDPIYTYNDTGYFNVTLIATNFGCDDTLKLDKYIHVRPPIAKFDTSFLCSDPLTRNFIDQSVGANTWNWKFGDGNTSQEQNPSHTYSSPGSYTVSLTVTNGSCQHTKARNVEVVKERGNLSISDSISCVNTRIIFNVKNIKENNISLYNWYFNGMPGEVIVTGNNPVAWSFNTPGVRNMAVVLTDVLNCNDTLVAPVPIKSYGPKAVFGSFAPNTCYGNTVNFYDSSTTDGIHPITEYLWSYGEGSTQTYSEGPYSHDYTTPGTFNVKLVVKDSYGCRDSVTQINFVSITKPVARFVASDTSLCPALPITFNNKSEGVGATYQWNFGDGTTSDAGSPVHSYTQAGSYKVSLIVIDKNGCTSTDSTTINIYSAKADFAMSDSFSTCPPLVVNIKNNSANYVDLNWDFGDGGNSQLTNPSHIYTYPGHYTVKLSVRNNGGCVDELTKKVVIEGPTGVFDYFPKAACNPGKVDYTISAANTVSYIWDFNDGSTIFSVKPSAAHTYLNPGIYLPKIILQDSFGCKVAIKGLDTITVYSVSTNILSNTKLLCDSGIVYFSDSSITNDKIKSYQWNFGDGKTSNLANPNHSYADTGCYNVKLITTTNFGCRDTSFSKSPIKVINRPSIKMLGDTSACEPAKILLTGGFQRTDTSSVKWEWDFGNGSSSNLQKPDSQTYINSGSYNVKVKATNSDGCFTEVSRTAVIHPKPVVDAGPDKLVCRFDSSMLTATGANIYKWISHPTLSCTNCAMPIIKPTLQTTYYVTGTTVFGCTNNDSVKINVQQPFTMTVAKGDTLCKGETLALKASGADTYTWSPSSWLDNPGIASPKARPDSTMTYQVVGKDVNGCFKDTQNVKIKVYPIPSVDITNGDNVTIQVGGSVKLNTKSSADVTSWKWFPSQWLSCASCTEPLAAPKERITYSVTATNEGKCTATDKVTVNLICDNTNVFIPNTFSPNGDGINDVFYLRGAGIFNVLSFRVFNRWGQLVFQKNGGSGNNPLDGWDGNLNGLPLQPDVYVYLIDVVCASNIVFPFKGNVSLIR